MRLSSLKLSQYVFVRSFNDLTRTHVHDARQLLESIGTSTVVGLRDRALIGLMVYAFARVGAATGMDVVKIDFWLWR